MAKTSLRETKLHGWHVNAGARMTDFGGWDMPVQYATGPREEHLRVRSAAGLFDIDHMGRFAVTGPAALDVLQGIQTWDVSAVAPGSAHYSLLCTESGGITDDIFLYHLETGVFPRPDAKPSGKASKAAKPVEWLIVVNASNRKKDLAWLKENSTMFNVDFRDISAETCMIALQGPASRGILQALTDVDLGVMKYHRVRRFSVAGASCIVCTTGYTGEPGYEMLIPAARAEEVWRAILSAGAPRGLIPCGLASRDSLRAEACLPLYGHEITEDTDPFSAGLGRAAVRMEGHDFMGKQALQEVAAAAGPRKLICFRMMAPSVPRQGYRIQAGSRGIGAVTTGLFSPSTGGYVGMGYVDPEFTAAGTELRIVIRDSPKPAVIVERPFYKSPHWSGQAVLKAVPESTAPAPAVAGAAPTPAPAGAASAPAAPDAKADGPAALKPDAQGGKDAV
jgi:aminomethyltransferase